MNNQLTAANLAGYGRGPDTTLVHMAPQEVAGLQALAMAHGGSLTINPETGLPEAGFLSSILPTLAGFALGPAGFGVMSSLGAAATVGGLSALTSGSLSKGLVAGLGAYGGSELGGGLEALGKQGAAQAAATMADAGATGPLTGAAFSNSAPAALSGWDATKAGFQQALNDPKALITQLGGNMGALKTAGMAVAPMLADQSVQTVTKAPETPQYYRPMIMNRQQTGGIRLPGAPATSQKRWFEDTYTVPEPRSFADGGLTYPENPYYSLTGASEDAYRYLMGLAPRSRPPATVTPLPDPTEPGIVMPKKPEPVVTPVTGEGGGGNGRGDDFVGGRGDGFGSGFPGSGVDQYGVSTPTTGLASLANKTSAVLGNLGFRSLSDAIARNVDPNYGHEGMSGRPGGRTGPNLTGNLPTLNVDTGEESYDTTPDTSGWNIDSLLGGNAITGGVTPAGAGIAANPMGVDPAQSAQAAADAAAAANAAANAAQAAAEAADRSDSPMGGAYGGGDVDGGAGNAPGTGNNDGGRDSASGGLFMAHGGMIGRYASGGLGSLGGYSDGGRLLRGPGDGVSDSIPATIGRGRQPARLADGEFVVPARIVSELGNGSTEAGARKLYAMMDRIQANRRKSMGKKQVAVNSRSERLLPA